MNYTETLDYLFSSMPSFQQVGGDAYKPGLERITEFCRIIGNPQRNYFVIHIAGTNGKGSTIAFMGSILKEAGYKVGKYTSPVVFEYLEKYQINDENIKEEAFAGLVSKVKIALEQLEKQGI